MGLVVPAENELSRQEQDTGGADLSSWPTLEQWDAETGFREKPAEPYPWERLARARVQAVEARSLTPEQAARDRELADTYGVPSEQVALNRAVFEERKTMDKASALAERSPRLSGWAAARASNVVWVNNDAEAMTGLFDGIVALYERETGALGAAWEVGELQQRLAAEGNALRSGDESALVRIQCLRSLMEQDQKLYADSWLNRLYLDQAVVQQVPRMLDTTLKSATEALGMGLAIYGGATLAGAGAGAAAGSIVPGAGTAAGGAGGALAAQPAAVGAGLTAASATYLARQAQRSFSLERGLFIADLASEKDEDGNPLPVNLRNLAGDAYGLVAAAIETGGEAFVMGLLKPLVGAALPGEAGKEGLKRFVKSAVKRAALDKSLHPVLLNVAGKVAAGAVAEGLEEGSQELASVLAEVSAKGLGNRFTDSTFLDNEALTSENAFRIGQAAGLGALGGVFFHGAPLAVSGIVDARAALRAKEFAQGQSDIHARVEVTRLKQLSPAILEDALKAAHPGMSQPVQLPADAVLELHQSGIDLLEPLGWKVQDVAEAADLGQELEVPLARLHAVLDQSTFDAASRIMRESPQAASLADAGDVEARVAEDAERVATVYDEYVAEQNAFERERERVRAEAVSAVESVPGLKAQAEALAGSVENYVDAFLKPLEGFARRMTQTGTPLAETFRRLAVRGLERSQSDLDPALMSEEAFSAWEQEQFAQEQGPSPFLESVRGRLDGKALKRDWPDAYRELSAKYGPRLFKKGGVAPDVLADELVTAGLLPHGSGADELVERLKEGRKLFQPLNEGVNLDAPVRVVEVTPRFAGRNLWQLMKGPERNALKQELAGVYDNAGTGWKIRLTGKGVEHAISSAKKSMNGEAHMEAVAGLPGLIENAVLVESHADRKGQRLSAVHRMYTPMLMGEDVYAVKLTVKESEAGMVAEVDDVRRLYDLALEKKMPGDLRQGPDAAQSATGNQDSTPGISEITLRQLLDGVNDSEGNRFFQNRASHGSVTIHSGLLPHGSGADELVEKLRDGRRLFQPLNEGVDLDAPVRVVEVTPRFGGQNPKVLRKRFPEEIRRAVLEKFRAGVVNKDTGKKIGMSSNDFREHFDSKNSGLDLVHLEAIAALPELMRVAKLVESHGDSKKTSGSNIKQVHRFMSALRVGKDDFAVKLTVKEFNDGTASLNIENPVKLYHHRIEKALSSSDTGVMSAMPTTIAVERDVEQSPPRSPADINAYEYSLRYLLEGVKDSEGIDYFQKAGASSSRGSVTIHSEGYLINLFKKADLSTLLHETGHVFLEEIERALDAGIADERMTSDYAAVRAWLGVKPGETLSRERREQFARGFEAYLREGKAPTRELASVFERFKKWLTRIYRQAAQLNVELTDEVRAVFDRLLATENEVETAAAENRLLDLTAQELDALGLKGADRVYASGLMKAARDAAAVRLRQARDRELKALRAVWAKEARQALDRDPVYAARRDMRAQGLDLDTVREEYGEAFARDLMQAIPASLRHGGADPEIFAAQHGFESAADMLSRVKAAPAIARAVLDMVEQRQVLHDANYDAADYLIETDETAEQMALVGEYLSKHIGGRNIEQQAVARVAAEKFSAMPMGKAVQSGVFRQAMRRALEAERRAIVKGDFKAALEANHKARLNMEFARQSLEIQRNVERLQGGIKRFTRMRKADPDARFIVVDIARRHGLGEKESRTLFQTGRPVVVRGDELGVVDGAGIKEYQKAAREVYRKLQNTPARREDLGEIRFTGAGFGKISTTGADPRKWMLIPKLKDIIENAKYIQRTDLNKARQDDIVAFHWLETDVELNGEPLRVGVQIAEDRQGNKFYNLNQDLERWGQKYEAPERSPTQSTVGTRELHQDGIPPLEETIGTDNDNVNLTIGETGRGRTLFQTGRPVVVRGDELGVVDGAGIKEYQKAAREVYRKLQNTPARREDLGEIRFTGAGFGEIKKNGADPRKWKLVPFLREIIENASYIRRAELSKTRKDRIRAFHWLETDVQLDGKLLRVGVNIAEDADGNKFYSFNQDLESWKEKYEAPDNRSGQSTPGAQELHQDGIPPLEETIGTDNDNVNLTIGETGRGRTLFQTGRPVVVRGDELGVADGAGIKEYQKAAREVYRKLQNTPARREDLGEIRFTGAGFGKISTTGADVRKWQLVGKLKEIIEYADYIERHKLTKQRHDNIVAFHWLEAGVELNGEPLRVGVQIAEDAEGNKFYNLNQDLDAWERKYGTPEPNPAQSTAGAQEFHQDGVPPLEETIGTDDGNVNLTIGETGRGRTLFQTGRPVVVRGDELGVADGAGIKEYITAAKKCHDALKYESEHGKPVYQPQLNRPVRFSGKGFRENAHSGANIDKWKLFPKLREIIENSELIESTELAKQRKDAFVRFHWVESDVILGEKAIRIGLTLAEDGKGNLFYNLNAAPKKTSGSETLPANSRAGESEPLFQDAKTPLEKTIGTDNDNVNLVIREPEQNVFRPEPVSVRDASTIRDWIAAVEADGYSLIVDDAVLYGPEKSWRDLTGTQFENLAETVNQIIMVERNRRQLLTAQSKADLNEVAEEAAASIRAHVPQQATKTVEDDNTVVALLERLHVSHLNADTLTRLMDGDRMGPVWQHVIRPINAALGERNRRLKEAKAALRELFEVYSRKELAAMRGKKVFVPEIGEKLTHENRLMIALNMGNASNMERLVKGHGWTQAQLAAVLGDLTARDWHFVQGVWDYLDTFRAEAFAMEEKLHGLRPKAVEAAPLTVTTADGTTLHLRGGYFPVAYNPAKSARAPDDANVISGKGLMASVPHGHLKERTGNLEVPLKAKLDVIPDHIFKVVHDLAFRPAVLDVAKFLRHKTVQAAMQETAGVTQYRALWNWLRDVAQEGQGPRGDLDAALSWARSSQSLMSMGYKIGTMTQQITGLLVTLDELGPKWTAAGVKAVWSHPEAAYKEAASRSSFMANRINSVDREVADYHKKLLRYGRFKWHEAIRDHAFAPMGWVQMISSDLPTWWGAYEKGLRDFAGDEARAAEYADNMVEITQAGGALKNLASIQRGGEAQKLFTMYYTFFGALYQIGARRVTMLARNRDVSSVMRAANTALLLWFVMPLLSELLAGRGPDDEDGDDSPDWFSWAAENTLTYPLQAVIGVREVASGLFGEYGFRLTPAESSYEAVLKAGKAIWKELDETEDSDFKNTARAVTRGAGYAFKSPLGGAQAITTVWNLWDWLDGSDPVFEARDLFFTKPKDK